MQKVVDAMRTYLEKKIKSGNVRPAAEMLFAAYGSESVNFVFDVFFDYRKCTNFEAYGNHINEVGARLRHIIEGSLG